MIQTKSSGKPRYVSSYVRSAEFRQYIIVLLPKHSKLKVHWYQFGYKR